MKKLERWVVIVWAIWNARNRFCFENVRVHSKKILNGAIVLLEDYHKQITMQRCLCVFGLILFWLLYVSISMFLVHSFLDGHGLLVQAIDVYEFFLLLFNTNFYLFSKEN